MAREAKNLVFTDRLQNDYDKKRAASKKNKKEKQKSGLLLEVPSQNDPDASLESVDLDDPEDDEDATKTLEAFLNEPDAIYDVSPLPKDEVPIQKDDTTVVPPCDVPINIMEASSSSGSSPKAEDESALASVAESLYYTPDATTDLLSDISLN